MTTFQFMGVCAGSFVSGVVVGVWFKDAIVAGFLNVTNFPARAWAAVKVAAGAEVAKVEATWQADMVALQAKVDAAFGKSKAVVQVVPVQAPAAAPVAAPAPDAPAAATDAANGA